MKKVIDIRSDTVTRPTKSMRDAMYRAEVGDDVLGDDPTVIRLQELASELLCMEDALFVTSGTMANQIAVMAFCSAGDQIIVHDRSHIYNLEVGGLASTCHVQPRSIHSSSGFFDYETISENIHLKSIQGSPTKLICLENSFDLNRGLAVPPDQIDAVSDYSREKGLKVYVDGARHFNASVSLGVKPSELCRKVDALSFCLSKGLSCPVGSILLGDTDFIDEARRMRQRIGGGWRQAGILAAAGIVGITEMIQRLEEDHFNAKELAQTLLDTGLEIDLEQVQTNIVLAHLETLGVGASDLAAKLIEYGVYIKPVEEFAIRMVTHNDFDPRDIPFVKDAIDHCLKSITNS